MATSTISQLYDLKGKGAIVTGAGMGIGQAVAFRLAEAGAGVLIADINLEAAKETVRQILAKDGIAVAIQADAASPADAERVAQEAFERFGPVNLKTYRAIFSQRLRRLQKGSRPRPLQGRSAGRPACPARHSCRSAR